MTIDLKAIRAAAEAATPIYTDLLGDRYFSGDYSTATLTKGQDDFVSVTTPATILELLDRLEAAEKDAARLDWILAYFVSDDTSKDAEIIAASDVGVDQLKTVIDAAMGEQK